MKAIHIHRNPGCKPCEEQSALTQRLDWLGKVEVSTEVPAEGGEVAPGTIAVQDLRTGEWFRGAAAMRKICAQVPLYWPAWLLLSIPPVARAAEWRQAKQSREAIACELPRG